MEKIDYLGWPNCYRLSNNVVDLIVTTDVGPRVIRFGFTGEENAFKEVKEHAGLTGGDEWRLYGGHRLWHAPESLPRSYQLDNTPVEIEEDGGVVRVTQPTESATGIQKQIDLRLWPGEAHVTVTHRLTNHSLWPVELAPWALSVMAAGGTGIMPLPPRGPHPENLLPTSSFTVWPYTNMADPRWTWGTKYILLRQNPEAEEAQKGGLSRSQGWTAYARDGLLFVKLFETVEGASYPDFGCSLELYTDAGILEVETLAPLRVLEPETSVEHIEEWHLFRDVRTPTNDKEVDEHVLPKVRAVKP
jgi:hypothetical protein